MVKYISRYTCDRCGAVWEAPYNRELPPKFKIDMQSDIKEDMYNHIDLCEKCESILYYDFFKKVGDSNEPG